MFDRVPARPSRPRSRLRPAPAGLALLILVLATAASGCPCVSSVVNASDGLRWWLFSSFGAQRACPEMLEHGGVPLRLAGQGAAIGRFFPTQCAHRVNDQARTISIDLTGTGYAFVQPARRVGFSCSTSVEYRPDFQLVDDDVYVWGRLSRILAGPDFRLGYVESPVASAASSIGPLGLVINQLGNQVVTSELTRGFTIVHNEDTGNDFALGIVLPPNKPSHPYGETDDDALTIANETIELHGNQRDYIGPFTVPDEDRVLSLKLSVQGPSGIDLLLVSKPYGDAWREAYQTGTDTGGPPGPVFMTLPLAPGFVTRRVAIPPGRWYLVADHTARAGMIAPPPGPYDPVVQVTYAAQLIED
jgi:hypothetical protein